MTFLKYCLFCCMIRNQSACFHRWGEICFFFPPFFFQRLLENLTEKLGIMNLRLFILVPSIDTCPRKSHWPALIRKQCKICRYQEFCLFSSLVCAWGQNTAGTQWVFKTYLLTMWMDYNRIFMHEFFLKIPPKNFISINVRILIAIFCAH